MKIVYLCHPIAGDIQANLADLRRIIRSININFPDVVPFCPYYADVVSMDDNIPNARERGLRNCETTVLLAHEVWMTGDKITSGMEREAAAATRAGIPTVYKIGESWAEERPPITDDPEFYTSGPDYPY